MAEVASARLTDEDLSLGLGIADATVREAILIAAGAAAEPLGAFRHTPPGSPGNVGLGGLPRSPGLSPGLPPRSPDFIQHMRGQANASRFSPGLRPATEFVPGSPSHETVPIKVGDGPTGLRCAAALPRAVLRHAPLSLCPPRAASARRGSSRICPRGCRRDAAAG